MFVNKKSAGVTFFELLISVSILTILSVFVIIILKPKVLYAETRDKKRISDISTLERIVVESKVDTQTYPGDADTTYTSTSLPSGALGPLTNISTGWLGANSNLKVYYSKLPIDPLNEEPHVYTYRHDGDTYELNAVLEENTHLMETDGGDDDAVYEIGNDLTLL